MFLFGKDQLRSPIATLSGGERARVHLALLMLAPADVLVLDEPTNDLDIPTLEVLEESLEEFPGAVLLVTHDRAMLERLANRVLVLDGTGGAHYYADYLQFVGVQARLRLASKGKGSSGGSNSSGAAAVPAPAAQSAWGTAPASGAATGAGGAGKASPSKRKLSYKEQKEFDAMDGNIAKAEADVQRLEKVMNDPAVLADRRKLDETCKAMTAAQAEVARLYARWQELGG
jgi:ATP-binding cassette subfamily F protein uup